MTPGQPERWEWDLGLLPFVWTPLPTPANGPGIPDSLPFKLTTARDHGTLVQVPCEETRAALKLIYERGSQISGMMDDTGIGRDYAEDYLAFLLASPGSENLAGRSVLEIGSGTGYLLHRLQRMGASVLGIEPGAHGEQAGARFGVEVIRDFFPSSRVRGRFDLLTFFAVLEHIEQPVEFLRSLRPSLADKGVVALAVPNCEPFIRIGDVSILLHEHWSYFTAATLKETVEAAGYEPIRIQPSGFGGSLYCLCKPRNPPPAAVAGSAGADRAAFETAAGAFNRRLKRYFDEAGGAVGIFVPQRIVNAAALARLPLEGCRFFDDNPCLHNTYFPGIGIPVEPREALLKNPTPNVLIMSQSFGAKIASELTPMLPATKISTLADLLK